MVSLPWDCLEYKTVRIIVFTKIIELGTATVSPMSNCTWFSVGADCPHFVATSFFLSYMYVRISTIDKLLNGWWFVASQGLLYRQK
jgi:hypothetical protein